MSERIVESSRVLNLRFVECPLDGEKKLEMLIEEKYFSPDYTGGGFVTEWREVPTVSYLEAYPDAVPGGLV